jgi:hypothetical protein
MELKREPQSPENTGVAHKALKPEYISILFAGGFTDVQEH